MTIKTEWQCTVGHDGCVYLSDSGHAGHISDRVALAWNNLLSSVGVQCRQMREREMLIPNSRKTFVVMLRFVLLCLWRQSGGLCQHHPPPDWPKCPVEKLAASACYSSACTSAHLSAPQPALPAKQQRRTRNIIYRRNSFKHAHHR